LFLFLFFSCFHGHSISCRATLFFGGPPPCSLDGTNSKVTCPILSYPCPGVLPAGQATPNSRPTLPLRPPIWPLDPKGSTTRLPDVRERPVDPTVFSVPFCMLGKVCRFFLDSRFPWMPVPPGFVLSAPCYTWQTNSPLENNGFPLSRQSFPNRLLSRLIPLFWGGPGTSARILPSIADSAFLIFKAARSFVFWVPFPPFGLNKGAPSFQCGSLEPC